MSASLFHRGYHAPVAKLLAELRESYQDIAEQQFHEWDNREPVGSLEPAHRAVEAATRNLERIKDTAQTAMAQLAEQRLLKTQAYRQFKLDHGVTRDARILDILTTMLIALVAMLVEGAATAALMVADGKMDIPAAAAYGASVTVLNYATGMFAGYFTARYLDYRADSPTPGPRDHRTRWIARAGFAALVGMLVLLNFGAARVRATGEDSGIFDFETASFFATFDDYYALAVLGLGVLGGMLGIYKGYSGISDPIPGFTEARREAEDATMEHVGESHEYNPLNLIADDFWRKGGLQDVSDDVHEMSLQLYPEPKGGDGKDDNVYFREGSRTFIAFAVQMAVLLNGYEATLGDVVELLNDRESLLRHAQWAAGRLELGGEDA